MRSYPTLPAKRRLWQILVIGLVTCMLTACGDESKAPKAARDKKKSVHLVEVIQVDARNQAYTTVRTGTLIAPRQVRVFNQEEGRVALLPFHEGDYATADALLVQLDDSLLKAELNKAAAQRRQAESDIARLTKLKGRRLVAEDELTRAQTLLEVAQSEESLLRTRLAHTVIHAPFAGTISARLVEPGDVAPRHSHLLTLTDMQYLVTEVAVSDLLLPHLKIGDTQGVRIDALGDQEFSGRILRIHPTLDAQTRRGIIEVALNPAPQGARPGQLCRVKLTTTLNARLLIPFAALRRDPRGEHVFVIGEDGKAERKSVRSGLRIADRIEVLEGLNEGDRVITRGFLGLRAGKKVRIAGDKARTEEKPSASKPASSKARP